MRRFIRSAERKEISGTVYYQEKEWDIEEQFAWWPVLLTNGSWCVWKKYYIVTIDRNVDARHRWIDVQKLSYDEYFWKVMSGEIPQSK